MKDFVAKEPEFEIDEKVAAVTESENADVAEQLLSPSGSFVNDFVVMYSSVRKPSQNKTVRIKTKTANQMRSIVQVKKKNDSNIQFAYTSFPYNSQGLLSKIQKKRLVRLGQGGGESSSQIQSLASVASHENTNLNNSISSERFRVKKKAT